MITLTVDGKQYTLFTRVDVSQRLDATTDVFSFEASPEEGKLLPFKGGEACQVRVDGDLVLTGSIEIVTVDYDDTNHIILIEGRDKTGDLIDSSLGPISSLSGEGLTVAGAIERVIEELGSDIEVVDTVNPEPFNKAEDIGSPQPGDNAFEFIERFTRKRQVLATSNPEGNVELAPQEGTRIQAFLQMVVGSNSNNIMVGSVTYDTTGRFNAYRFTSSLNPVALNSAGKVGVSDVVDQTSDRIIDDQVRAGRQMVLVAEGPFSSGQNTDRAEWEKKIRQARGRVYTVTVDGYRNQTGDLWKTNTIVKVTDEFADIDGDMLINSVRFSFDADEGKKTVLTLVEPNAYTLTLEEPMTGTLGDGLFG